MDVENWLTIGGLIAIGVVIGLIIYHYRQPNSYALFWAGFITGIIAVIVIGAIGFGIYMWIDKHKRY